MVTVPQPSTPSRTTSLLVERAEKFISDFRREFPKATDHEVTHALQILSARRAKPNATAVRIAVLVGAALLIAGSAAFIMAHGPSPTTLPAWALALPAAAVVIAVALLLARRDG